MGKIHQKIIDIVVYPSLIVHPRKKIKHRQFKRIIKQPVNATCLWRGHTYYVDFKNKTRECQRCGRMEEE